VVIVILGNPYKFAILLEVVNDWNVKDKYSFYNGILEFYVNGNIFPYKMVNATLGSEVPNLIRQFSHISINKRVFDMKREKAFFEIYHIIYPDNEDIDNDSNYDITPYSFCDINCHVFAVSNGEQIRILAANLECRLDEETYQLNNIEIAETYISIDDVNDFVTKLNAQLSLQTQLNETYKI
jgi:hypothetical protein